MDAWLKYHLAFILPVAYVCYAVDCHLQKTTKQQRKAIMDAALQDCKLLRAMGIHIRKADNDDYYTLGRKFRRTEIMVYLMAKNHWADLLPVIIAWLLSPR